MSFFNPYWWTREDGDDEDPRGLANTGTPIRQDPEPKKHWPAWAYLLVTLACVLGVLRIAAAAGQWQSCGAQPADAWARAVTSLGGKPTVLECLDAGLNSTSGSGDQAPAIEPPTTEPPPLVTNPDGSPVLYPNGDGTFHDSRYGKTDCADGGCTAYGPCPGGVPPASHFVCQDP